ncbi:BAZ1A protein-like protein [Amazona aestiva]|uniref:BAZ1A protein-like protein n=1 Tax=Amazona aestiva TaxID=12930 RepID=A0A0Q3U2K0_AMAAE|nr:BAZ1A protein-like protein [Amazona aestiva]
MPLLHRKPFVRQKPPADLRPDERVFYCRVTNEIFRDYDDFFERIILCNSLVWSCAVTGKPGLTYQEALESEKKARQNLQSFPEALIIPVLYLATLTHCSRLHEICDEIFAYVKDRYFVGETVEVVRNNGASLEAAVEAGQLSRVWAVQFFGLRGGFAKECQLPDVREVDCLYNGI